MYFSNSFIGISLILETNSFIFLDVLFSPPLILISLHIALHPHPPPALHSPHSIKIYTTEGSKFQLASSSSFQSLISSAASSRLSSHWFMAGRPGVDGQNVHCTPNPWWAAQIYLRIIIISPNTHRQTLHCTELACASAFKTGLACVSAWDMLFDWRGGGAISCQVV